MLLAGLVVLQAALLQGLARDGQGDDLSSGIPCQHGRHFDRVVGVTCVSADVRGNLPQRFVVGLQSKLAEAARVG